MGTKNKAFNDTIIDIFRKLRRYYEIKNDIWRIKAYREAIETLEAYDGDITSVDNIPHLPGLGKRSIEKIKEIIRGATIKDFIPKDGLNMLIAYEKLILIRDVGPKRAKELVLLHKIRSIDDLRHKVKTGKVILNDSQLIGLKYYEDLIQKIPHKEIKYIDKLIQKVAKNVNKNLHALILGSYRRKKPFSNDIDILLYHPNVKTKKDLPKGIMYLASFIEELRKLKIISAELKIGSLSISSKSKSINLEYLFKTKYSKYNRKVDVKFFPYSAHITAIIYFTGSRRFNRFMREKFKRKGYLLNQYGLFKNNVKIPIKNERQLFHMINMKYLPPEKRN